MDKEQAIEKLNDIRCHVKETSAEEQALVMAIDALKQPVATDTNVGDKISRRATIDAVNNAFDRETLLTGFVRSIAVRAIRDMPTIQPEPKWIPVSERLPEKGGEYLVSVHHTIGAISVFHPEKDTYVDDVAIMKYCGKFPSTVRAWMPKPEHYKPNNK